jgi:hypothetical protein
MRFEGIIYENHKITDFVTFEKLTDELQNLLKNYNGVTCLHGGFQIRGCVNEPKWISLEEIWTGKSSLYKIYDLLLENDIPFGQDCFGDQFLLRNNEVIKLSAETGEVEFLSVSLAEFLTKIEDNAIEFLNIPSFDRFIGLGIELLPGQMINVYPPFALNMGGNRSFRAVSAIEQIDFLKYLYLQIRDLPDGAQIEIKVN